MRKFCHAAVGLMAAAAIALPAGMNNPLEGSEPARRAGAKLYARECAACHGPHREGIGKAPPLERLEVDMLFRILRNGSLRRGMPSFAHLPEPQRWQIITFLRSRPPDAGRAGASTSFADEHR